MELTIPSPNGSAVNLMRRCGYAPHPADGQSFIRRAGPNPYTRFHIYVVPEGPSTPARPEGTRTNSGQADGIRLRLHLDQKKPSYEGSAAHSGEYDSEVVVGEMDRIKNVLNLRTTDGA